MIMRNQKVKNKRNTCHNTIKTSSHYASYYVAKLVAAIVIFSAVLAAVFGYLPTLPHASVIGGKVIDGKVQLVIRNSGGGTAYQAMLVEPHIFAGDYPPKCQALFTETLFVEPNKPTDLAPGQEVTYEHGIDTPSKRELVRQRLAIYASGTVSCKDWVGFRHTEPFSLIYGGPFSVDSPNMGIWNSTRQLRR